MPVVDPLALRLLSTIPDGSPLECAKYRADDFHGDLEQAGDLAHDLFLGAIAAVLDEAGNPQFAHGLADIPAAVLASREVKLFTERLRAFPFSRFALRRLVERTLDVVELDHVSRAAYETYLRPSRKYTSLTPRAAEDLWRGLSSFVVRWTSGRVFAVVFAGGTLDGATSDAFLADLMSIFERTRAALGPHAAWNLLGFWLEGAHAAELWGDAEPASIKQGRQALLTVTTGVAGEGGWFDYFLAYNSQHAVTMLVESAPELYFPVDALRAVVPPDVEASWLGDDFQDRIGPATYNVEHNVKGKRVKGVCKQFVDDRDAKAMAGEEGPFEVSGYTSRDLLETQRYISSLTVKHFLGEIAELLALPLVVRTLGSRFPSGATCVPGTAIRLQRGRRVAKGPDGLVGSLRAEGDLVVFRVHAIIEVKGYAKSATQLLEQFENKHLRRLRSHSLRLSCSSFAPGGRWLATLNKSVSERGRSRIEVMVDRCEVDDDVLLVAVVPGQVEAIPPAHGLLRLSLLWTDEGLRALTRSFLLAILRESGNKVDEDQLEYYLGQTAWNAAVQPLLANPGLALTPEDRSTIRQLGQPEVRPDDFMLAVCAGALPRP